MDYELDVAEDMLEGRLEKKLLPGRPQDKPESYILSAHEKRKSRKK
jgi:hypothetical protein